MYKMVNQDGYGLVLKGESLAELGFCRAGHLSARLSVKGKKKNF